MGENFSEKNELKPRGQRTIIGQEFIDMASLDDQNILQLADMTFTR